MIYRPRPRRRRRHATRTAPPRRAQHRAMARLERGDPLGLGAALFFARRSVGFASVGFGFGFGVGFGFASPLRPQALEVRRRISPSSPFFHAHAEENRFSRTAGPCRTRRAPCCCRRPSRAYRRSMSFSCPPIPRPVCFLSGAAPGRRAHLDHGPRLGQSDPARESRAREHVMPSFVASTTTNSSRRRDDGLTTPASAPQRFPASQRPAVKSERPGRAVSTERGERSRTLCARLLHQAGCRRPTRTARLAALRQRLRSRRGDVGGRPGRGTRSPPRGARLHLAYVLLGLAARARPRDRLDLLGRASAVLRRRADARDAPHIPSAAAAPRLANSNRGHVCAGGTAPPRPGGSHRGASLHFTFQQQQERRRQLAHLRPRRWSPSPPESGSEAAPALAIPASNRCRRPGNFDTAVVLEASAL